MSAVLDVCQSASARAAVQRDGSPANSPFPLGLRASVSTVFPGPLAASAALAVRDAVPLSVARSLASFREPGRDYQSAMGAGQPQDEIRVLRVLPQKDGREVSLLSPLAVVVRRLPLLAVRQEFEDGLVRLMAVSALSLLAPQVSPLLAHSLAPQEESKPVVSVLRAQ